MKIWRNMMLFAIAMGPIGAQAADLTIVTDGRPNAVIIVAMEPSPPAAPADSKAKSVKPAEKSKWLRAAEAIQTYVEKMSGARLPIVEEGQPVEGKPVVTILVGDTKAARKLGVKIPGGFNPAIRPEIFEEEGYVLKTLGASLVVAGNNDGPYQGTLYAAYALLEKLGCRWFFPGEWGEVVPERTTIVVPELDLVSHPDFAIRSAACPADWALKIGFNPHLDYPLVGDNFLGDLLPPSEYAEEHPEFYAMNKQGMRTTTPKSRVAMLCLSNPDVLVESVKNLKLAFAGKKKMRLAQEDGFGISPPDGSPYCYCPVCKAQSQNFSYPKMGRINTQSEEYYSFAAKLAREFPDKWVSTMAYSLREIPPQGVELPRNVAVKHFPITTCALHAGDDPGCWRRMETLQILAGFRKLTPHVTLAHYVPSLMSVYSVGQSSLIPERDMANFITEAPILKKIGIKGVEAAAWGKARSCYMAIWLSYYIRAKLSWDVTTDVAALKKDFYTTFFGPAAGPHVQAWWDACEDALGRSTAHTHEDWVSVRHIYTVPFVNKIHAHVEAALKAGGTPEQRSRVELFALIADHLEAYAAMNDAESKLDYEGAIAAAERMLNDVRKLHEAYSHFGVPELPQRQVNELKRVAAKLDGTKGSLVAPLPLEMTFTRDPHNEGVLAEWYAPDFDDSAWETKNTFLTWDQQDPPEDAKGHDYDGYGWYRADIEVDKVWTGKPVRLQLGGILNEGWVWINGHYVGYKGNVSWWASPASLEADFDVSARIRPGTRNKVAIRVLNDKEIGGLTRRGFIYSPKETNAPTAGK